MPDGLGPGVREKEALPCKAKKGTEGVKGWERKAKLMLSMQVWTCMFASWLQRN